MAGATRKPSGARAGVNASTKAKAPARTASARVKTTAKATKSTKAAKAPAKAPTKVVKKATKAATAPAPAKAATVKKKTTVTCPLSGFEVTPGAPNLSPKTLERLRKKLLEEQERIQGQADELAAEAEQLARDREGGDTQFDEESGDGDTVNVERERDLLLSASARQVVDEIGDALARMKKGTYGVCTPAGRRLPLERLEAIPWANVCVDCKARAERRR